MKMSLKIYFGEKDDEQQEWQHNTAAVVEAASPELKRPKRYKVVLFNDDYTPMDFVVFLLKKIFNIFEEIFFFILALIKLIKLSGAAFTSTVNFITPFVATIWGYIFLNESLNLNQILGFIFILIGIYIVKKSTDS